MSKPTSLAPVTAEDAVVRLPVGSADARPIIAAAPIMRNLLGQARQVSASKVAVLIQGESGTGKELVARLIHLASPRALKPFIRVNCAALSESLVESELFGHEKGAFTGADECRPGRFELAHEGTLLLDEVSEMPVKLQAKLLRVLEEDEFERVGGAQTLRVDVRIVATTNRDLQEAMERGHFRRDLYYRLSGVLLHVPPLRVRRADIPVLVAHFFTQFRGDGRVPLASISPRALKQLTEYDWPGNVRQLRNVLQRACILAAGSAIQPTDLPPLEDPAASSLEFAGKTLAEIERQVILRTLRELGGNRTATAQQLGVSTRTLLNKLNRYREGRAA